MAVVTFDVDQFRGEFPAFADTTKYPDPILQGYFDAACCYIGPADYGYLRGDCRRQALYLLTAHLTQLGYAAAAGQNPGPVTSATVGEVSVATMQPPAKSQWQYWLASTPYGARLWALLNVKRAGGFAVGGLPEKSGFRKIGGTFAG